MHMRTKTICIFQIYYRPRTAVIYGRCACGCPLPSLTCYAWYAWYAYVIADIDQMRAAVKKELNLAAEVSIQVGIVVCCEIWLCRQGSSSSECADEWYDSVASAEIEPYGRNVVQICKAGQETQPVRDLSELGAKEKVMVSTASSVPLS